MLFRNAPEKTVMEFSDLYDYFLEITITKIRVLLVYRNGISYFNVFLLQITCLLKKKVSHCILYEYENIS